MVVRRRTSGRPSAIVLAAGEGTRMKSSRPKPLHVLCGRPMLMHVLDALRDIDVHRTVVVVGHGAERVTKRVQEQAPSELRIDFVEQLVQRGTGDAVAVGLTAFPEDDPDDESTIVVVPGDTPLLRAATIVDLVDLHEQSQAAATILTARLADPTGYGRIVRDRNDRVAYIVEQKEASPDELAINEINTSIYCFRRNLLAPALRRLSPENAQGEYYLTDVIAVLHDAGYTIAAHTAEDASEALGVNDRLQLAAAEAALRQRTNTAWLQAGVTMLDPAQTFIDVTVKLAADVTLFPGTILQGSTVIGPGCEIGPDTRLVDCVVGEAAVIENSVGRHADVGAAATVGPYCVLNPGSSIGPGVRTGPFYNAVAEIAD